jgi:hypothetical protein
MRSDFALDRGDVVQINPEFKNRMFAGCMMTITEVNDRRIMGYVALTGTDKEIGGRAYLFIQRDDIEFVGRAEWIAP